MLRELTRTEVRFVAGGADGFDGGGGSSLPDFSQGFDPTTGVSPTTLDKSQWELVVSVAGAFGGAKGAAAASLLNYAIDVLSNYFGDDTSGANDNGNGSVGDGIGGNGGPG